MITHMRSFPTLTTSRLTVRPFVMADLHAIHAVLDRCFGDGSKINDATALAERREWLQWAVLNYDALARLFQPPYGDRAIVLSDSGELIGSVGVVPYIFEMGQMPSFGSRVNPLRTAEVGLFWAVDPAHQGHGYASEAGHAVIDYLFTHERLDHIIATTEYDNLASQGVMRKLGMRLERNPYPEPFYLQVVGILENPAQQTKA